MQQINNKESTMQTRMSLLVISLIYAFFGATGSIFHCTRFLGVKGIDVLLLIMVFLVYWNSKALYIKLTKMHLLIAGLIIIYFYNNAGIFSMLFIFPSILFFVLLSLRMSTEWFDIQIKIFKILYCFFAIYTILERIHPVFLNIALLYFQNSDARARMIEQYSKGCMAGFTTHYSTNGMLLAVGAIIFFSEYINKKELKNGVWSIIFTLALLLTGKRGHVIFTFAAIFLGYYLNESGDKKTRRKKIFFVIISVIILLLIIVQFVPALSTFISRFEETQEEGDITLGRTKAWLTALEAFKANPVLGIGWGQFLGKGYWIFNAHNIYVQLLCETGLVGSTLYFIFFLTVLYKTYSKLRGLKEKKIDSYEARLLLFSFMYQIFFLLYGITGNPLYDQIMYIPYFFACSITINSQYNRFERDY